MMMTSTCGGFIVRKGAHLKAAERQYWVMVGWRDFVTLASNKHAGMCHYISVNGVVYCDYVVYEVQDGRW